MVTDVAYLSGRKKYNRPQAMLWADNPGVVITSGDDIYYVPEGYEIGRDPDDIIDPDMANQFLILSDNNRSPVGIQSQRIQNRQRMINGRMRSHYITDKLTIDISWDMLPSRSYATSPLFGSDGQALYAGQSGKPSVRDLEYTTDGGAGGVEILKWYENHPQSFWVYLAYDKYTNFSKTVEDEFLLEESEYLQLDKYNQVVEVFFNDFQYSVERRGGTNYDFWNIALSLEEV